MLDQLEGNRRRRCRTSTAPEDVGVETSGPSIRKELLIVKKKKTKKKTKKKDDAVVDEDGNGDSDSDGETKSKKKRKRSDSLDEDGYKKHSDDEADWSDVDDDPYKAGQKTLSSKEAERRREWGTGKSDIKMAGMAWPVFPRNSIHKVLGAVLDEVIRIDQEGLGNFSQPVPPETFPDYYDVVDVPMDYGTYFLLSRKRRPSPKLVSSSARNDAREARERRVSISSAGAKGFPTRHAELYQIQRP